jgi:hypothetical protein
MMRHDATRCNATWCDSMRYGGKIMTPFQIKSRSPHSFIEDRKTWLDRAVMDALQVPFFMI